MEEKTPENILEFAINFPRGKKYRKDSERSDTIEVIQQDVS